MSWPSLHPACVVAQAGEQTVIVDRRTGQLVVLDAVGSMLVQARDAFTDVHDAAVALGELFGRDESELTVELEQFEADLHEHLTVHEEGERASFASVVANSRQHAQPRATGVAFTRTVDCLGVGARITVHDPELAAVVEPLIDALPRASAHHHAVDLWLDGSQAMLTLDGRIVCDSTSSDYAIAELFAIATMLPTALPRRELLVHAACVELDGTTIILAGASDQGKSSTTVALLQLGAAYLTDDVTEIDLHRRTARGLARPIALKGPVRHLHPELRPQWTSGEPDRWLVAPARLGALGSVAPIAAVIVLEYAPDQEPQLDRLDMVEALALLTPLIFNLGDLDPELVGELWTALEQLEIIRLRHPGSTIAADMILQHLRPAP